jgi:hypothetical protein
MKKTMLSFFFGIFISFAYGQARLGYTEKEIRNESSQRVFDAGYTDEGIRFIFTTYSYGSVAYYFTQNGVCQTCMVRPNNQGSLNYLVEEYNRLYVIISDTKWKMYNNVGVMLIELIYDKSGDCHFEFTRP